MKIRRLMTSTGLGAAAAIVLVALPSMNASAVPTRPDDDAMVLARAQMSGDMDRSGLHAAQAALAKSPSNIGLATAAARLAIEEGRRQADPRLYGQAQVALAPWWNDSAPPAEVRTLRAVILQAFHDFPGAMADLDAILAANPGNAQARLSRAFVRMVTGDTDGAAQDCAALPPRTPVIAAQICKARLEALTGEGQRGRQRLTRVLSVFSGEDVALQRFALAVLADLSAGLGLAEDAAALYGKATADGDVDVPLLAAYADQLLDMGRPAEALALLDGKGEADILLLRRAIAARQLGDARLEQWAAILDERFAAAAAGGVRVHLREEARYRLEVKADAAGALDLALANWQVQKEPADARLLINCARAAGRPEAAAPVKDFMAQTGLADARVSKALALLEGAM